MYTQKNIDYVKLMNLLDDGIIEIDYRLKAGGLKRRSKYVWEGYKMALNNVKHNLITLSEVTK